jgi:glycerol kinase
MPSYLLAVDQGTTSTRSILFNTDLTVAAVAQQEFPQHFPNSGWVEHDPEDLWRTTRETMTVALMKAGAQARDVAAIGITNQRETTLVWDRMTGEAIHRGIVWQDRRTADACARLKEAGHEKDVTARTGLLLDPYFSGTKLAWILDHVPGARRRAEAGELAFGTVDSFLIWRLTGGRVHATDATNAARTLLYNIHTGTWDDQLLKLLNIPRGLLPDVRNSAGDFGKTSPSLLGTALPILGVAGDQQAATVGQACFEPGMMKSTYGRDGGCLEEPHADDRRLPARRQAHLRARGRHLHRRCGGAVAARWARHREVGERDRRTRRRGRSQSGRLSGPGLRRAWRALLERRSARRALRPDPRYWPQGACPRHA